VPDSPYPSPANRLRETAVGERPQERLEKTGPHALSDADLLAVLLRSGTRGQDVLTLSSRLLAEAGSLSALARWQADDFRRHRGIGRVKALQLVTVMELARRVLVDDRGTAPLLDRPDRVVDYLRPIAAALEVEKFWVLCLNRRNRLLKRVELTSGTANATLAHPREVFRAAVREGASAVLCVHNHPSGDPSPSGPDVQVTRQLRDAARLIDIALIDHVIVGTPAADPIGKGYYSFREAGVM
jgi:DNA repair protein RadC